MSKGWKIALGVTAVLGVVGVYAYNQYKLATQLVYAIDGFKIKSLSLQSLTANLSFKIQNKDKLKIDVKSFFVDVYSDKVFITRIENNVPFEILPNETTTTPTTLRLNPKQLLGNIGGVLGANKYKDIPLTFKGRIRAKKFGITFPIPFKVTYTIGEMM